MELQEIFTKSEINDLKSHGDVARVVTRLKQRNIQTSVAAISYYLKNKMAETEHAEMIHIEFTAVIKSRARRVEDNPSHQKLRRMLAHQNPGATA